MEGIDTLRLLYNKAVENGEEVVAVPRDILWQAIDGATAMKAKHDALQKWTGRAPEKEAEAKQAFTNDIQNLGEQIVCLAKEFETLKDRVLHLETHGASIIVGSGS